MAFEQFKLDRSVLQTRGIFDKYVYETGDTIAQVRAAGYFSSSRFSDKPDWDGSIVECSCSDGYIVGEVSGGTLNVLLNSNASGTPGSIERILDGFSVATSQEPTGLGEANQIQLEFGPAVNTGSDPVNLTAAGAIEINESDLYRLKISVTYGRLGASGTSELRFRALIDGAQKGQTIGVSVENANSEVPFSDEAWLFLPAGLTITYELMRDSSGNDSGGVFQPPITAATAPSWNPASCASIRVERFIS
jgi:hypothetical protein